MTSSDLPPLDDDLVDLLRRERIAEPFPPPGARERSFDDVMKRVAVAGASAAGTTAPPTSTRLLYPIAASMLALGLLLGAAAATLFAQSHPASLGTPSPEIVYVPVDVPIPYPAYLPGGPSSEATTAAVDDAVTVQDAPKSKASAPAGDSLAAERRLLDGARMALASGEPANALRLAERHRAGFPAGALVEEREAIATKALVDANRPAEARARGAAFERRFPESPMLRSVRSSLASLPAPSGGTSLPAKP